VSGWHDVTAPARDVEQAIRLALRRRGLDDRPPYDLSTLEIETGIRVRFSPYLRRTQMLIMGEFEVPDDWEELDGPERVLATLDQGCILFVHDPQHEGAC
jgi:hypothetical protein